MEFLVRDYTLRDSEHGGPEIRVVSLTELLKELDKGRKDDEVKIAVYEIGDCLLDWS